MVLRPITSIRRIAGRFRVFTISCPPTRAYIANGIVLSNCTFCAYRMSGYTSNQLFMAGSEAASYGHSNPKRWIPRDRAKLLLWEFKDAGVLSVQFTGGGEPTVHPDHEEIFRASLQLGLRCSLVSNGLKWSSSLIEMTLPRFDWIRVSIDAASEKEYAETRRTPVSAWKQVWKNVLHLADVCSKREQRPQIGLGYVVTPSSWQGIEEFARLASQTGAGNIRFTAMFSTQDEKPFLEVYDPIVAAIQKARRYEREDFKIHDNFGSRFDDLKQHSPDYSLCGYQNYTSYVGGDLRVYRCCVLAYNRRGLVSGGDLSKRSFAEFWKSQERKEDFASFDARGCPRCQFNAKNRALLYVMGNTESDTSPRHMEWP